MILNTIIFFSDDINFTLPFQNEVRTWICSVIHKHDQEVKDLNIIFCSDDKLLSMNEYFLEHSYLTDILTFPLHEDGSPIIAELFISIDRVRDNADYYQEEFIDELHRVIIHGVLHLLGYDDKSDVTSAIMRRAEADALKMREFGLAKK